MVVGFWRDISNAYAQMQFACGSSVIKDASQREQIDVQGDYLEDMPAFLIKTYASELESAAIVLIEDKQRRKYTR